MPLGRTTAGTLRLSVDETGLKYEVDLPDTPTANELRVALERQEITQSSFQFTVEDDSWEERDGQMYREIKKVGRLLDVAAVTFPAYPDATVALRKMENYKIAQKEKQQYKAEEKDLHYRSIRELKIKLLNQIKPNEIS
jgi:HK97 family phage prohead protease